MVNIMKRYAVIGLGKLGITVARTLTEKGGEVIAIDSDIKRVEEIKDDVAQALCLDSTDEEAMLRTGIADVEAAVVALGENIEVSVLTTALLKDLGVGKIIARAASPLHERALKRVGANQVVFPEEQAGEHLASNLIAPNIIENITLSTGHELAEIVVEELFVGKTLRALDFRATYGVNVIAIQKRVTFIKDTGEADFRMEFDDLPNPDDKIESGDILIVVGSPENIEKVAKADKQ